MKKLVHKVIYLSLISLVFINLNQILFGQPQIPAMTQTPFAPSPIAQIPQNQVAEEMRPVETPLDETRGNWYEKQQYYRQARKVIENIQQIMNQTNEFGKNFLVKQNKNTSNIAKFNLELGFERGELDARLTDLEKELKIEQERMRGLSEEERKTLKEIEEKKKKLESLKENLTKISELGEAINKTVTLSNDEIEKSKSYVAQAQNDLKVIEVEINDLKAKQLLAEIETFFENIKSIAAYLSGDLINFFDKKVQESNDFMEKSRKLISELKASGVELAKKVEKKEKEDLKKKEEECKKFQENLKKEQEAKAAKEKAEQSIWGRTSRWFSNTWQSIKDFFSGKNVSETPKVVKNKK